MTKKRILIVEDEAIVAMQIEASLKHMGYEVVGVASRGNDAIRIAKETWPDLILMDIRLEGTMDGIETANAINMYYTIPVIFLTAYSDDTTVSRVIKTKSYGFMTKPFNDRELYSNIELAIGKHTSSQKSQVEEAILSSIFSLIPDAVISTGPDGTLRRFNASAQALWDWSTEEIGNHTLFSILDPGVTDMETFIDSLDRMEKTKRGLIRWSDTVVATTGTGEQQQFTLTVEPIRGSDGELREFVLVLTHPIVAGPPEVSAVTPRQVIEIIKDPVYFMDSQLNLVLFNTAFQEFCLTMSYGTPEIDKPVFEMLPPAFVGDADGYRELFKRGAAWQGVVDMTNTSGIKRYFITTIPVFDDETVSHMATIVRPDADS
ncbi:response regulator [Methanogenium sp. S4BF]|uniref:response regulator n=1 Tax=Methanogenium sp. S4BF TaxID=1789226 RepID=UPI002417D647|nr:response regulator [Methanogenium sp. S4BF]WFN35562.1 response regulator [Methanogenium sp. S4BF]